MTASPSRQEARYRWLVTANRVPGRVCSFVGLAASFSSIVEDLART